jgi:two-component system sensor histidine kinase HydH
MTLANALRDCLACGVVSIQSPDRAVNLNGKAAQLLGVAATKSPNVPFADLPEPLQEFGREALKASYPPASRRLQLNVGAGRIEVQVAAAPLPGHGPQTGVVLLLTDLAAACELEDHIQQLNRLASLGTMAASMAHEIKNALVAGKTFIDLLLEKHQDAELAEIVRRELGRIDAIVGRMLNFSSASRPALSQVRLHEVLDHSLRLVRPQLERQAVALDRSFQAPADGVNGDEYELTQAFINLLLNALDAMGPNGTLTVRTELVGEHAARGYASGDGQGLRVTIADTGAGMSPEQQARIFEPFFTTKPNGTGLGLAITRRIIHEHQGDISVRSQPGQGTAFHIALPLLDQPAPACGQG